MCGDSPPPVYGMVFRRRITQPLAEVLDARLLVRPSRCGVCGAPDSILVSYDVAAIVDHPGAEERRALVGSYEVRCGQCDARAWLHSLTSDRVVVGWTTTAGQEILDGELAFGCG